METILPHVFEDIVFKLINLCYFIRTDIHILLKYMLKRGLPIYFPILVQMNKMKPLYSLTVVDLYFPSESEILLKAF